MSLKSSLIVVILLNGFLAILADTKVLAKVSIPVHNSLRSETISLDNDQQLVIAGSYDNEYNVPKDSQNVYILQVTYVADKDGFKAKYAFFPRQHKVPDVGAFLTPNTLKSLSG